MSSIDCAAPGGTSSPASSTLAYAPADKYIPQELWQEIIGNLDHSDLKNVRLVSRVFRDLATPFLFEHAAFSVVQENMQHMFYLCEHPELCKHIKTLYVDTSIYTSHISTSYYTKLLSKSLCRILLGSTDSDRLAGTPLSPVKLQKALTVNLKVPLGHEYLSGEPRRALAVGYAQFLARADFFDELGRDHGVYDILKTVISRLKSLEQVRTFPQWCLCPHRARDYLRQHLPAATLNLMPWLTSTRLLEDSIGGSSNRFLGTPGIAARSMDVMALPPLSPAFMSGTDEASHTFFITTTLIEALHSEKTILRELAFPGAYGVGFPFDKLYYAGSIPMEALCRVSNGSDHDLELHHKLNLFLPVFKPLKVLKLHIDDNNRGVVSSVPLEQEVSSLPRILQAMVNLEELYVGYADPLACMAVPQNTDKMSLYGTLLWREEDFRNDQDADNDSQGPNDGQDTPNAPHQALFTAINAAFGGSTTGDNAALWTPAHGPASTHFAAIDLATGAPLAGFFPSSAFPGLTGSRSAKSPDLPEESLFPNPWPKLRSISLYNMASRKQDIVRLAKTVAGTLRTLELRKVYLSDVKSSPSTTEANDIPEVSLAANIDTSATPLQNGLPQSLEAFLSSASDETATQSVAGCEDLWLETAEALEEILRNLQVCEIILHQQDEDALSRRLRDHIEGFANCRRYASSIVSNYVKSRSGMGLALFAAQQVQEYQAKKTALLTIVADLKKQRSDLKALMASGEDTTHGFLTKLRLYKQKSAEFKASVAELAKAGAIPGANHIMRKVEALVKLESDLPDDHDQKPLETGVESSDRGDSRGENGQEGDAGRVVEFDMD